MDEDEIWRLAELGEFDKIPTKIKLNKYPILKMVHRDYLMKKAECNEELSRPRPHGIWIWGEPHIGKSTFARKEFKDVWVKGEDDWWDGYIGQKYVMFEDIDRKKYENLGAQKVKTLIDKFPYPAKFRHVGQVMIRPEWIVFTSNFSPESVFGRDWAYMESRLKVIHYKKNQEDAISLTSVHTAM